MCIRIANQLFSNRFGYNNSIAGGFLSLPSWVETFPALDTVHTKGETKNHNSSLQVCFTVPFVSIH